MSELLTQGGVNKLLQPKTPNQAPVTLQVIQIERVKAQAGNHQYLVVLSDGVHALQTVLSSNLSSLVRDGRLKVNGFLCIDDYAKESQHKPVVVVRVAMALSEHPGRMIGSPLEITPPPSSTTAPKSPPQSQPLFRPPTKPQEQKPTAQPSTTIEALHKIAIDPSPSSMTKEIAKARPARVSLSPKFPQVVDLTSVVDLTQVVDLTSVVDLTQVVDLTPEPDLTQVSDLTQVVDLTQEEHELLEHQPEDSKELVLLGEFPSRLFVDLFNLSATNLHGPTHQSIAAVVVDLLE